MSSDQRVHKGRFRTFLILWSAGLVGVISYLPMILVLIQHVDPSGSKVKMPVGVIVGLAGLQTAVILAIAVAIGTFLTPSLGIASQVANAYQYRRSIWLALKPQILPGLLCGIVGAIFAYVASPSLIGYLKTTSIPTRLFYGGVTEEVLFRWGLMSLLIWIFWRIFQHSKGYPRPLLMWIGVILTDAIFAAGHIPILTFMGVQYPYWSAVTIFVTALPWGWLFWKWGLEAAIIAHMVFHFTVAIIVAA